MRRFRVVSAIGVLALAGVSLPGSAADSDRKVQVAGVEPMVIWNHGKGPTRNRQFARAFDLLDTEARILEKHYGPEPETIIGSMHCMGWNVAQSGQFVRGLSMDCEWQRPESRPLHALALIRRCRSSRA